MDKEKILNEIRRSALENGGFPVGQTRFERETGITRSRWRGRHWVSWSDALLEAGFQPNSVTEAHDRTFLVACLTKLALKNNRLPTHAEIAFERTKDKNFPSHHSFTRLGSAAERAELIRCFADQHDEYKNVLSLLPAPQQIHVADDITILKEKDGFVYLALLKIGNEKRYKIGKAVIVGRRIDQISIQLPHELELLHAIRTDDAFGIESYWHKRFEGKNLRGEWFMLSQADVRAFKLRKFM